MSRLLCNVFESRMQLHGRQGIKVSRLLCDAFELRTQLRGSATQNELTHNMTEDQGVTVALQCV